MTFKIPANIAIILFIPSLLVIFAIFPDTSFPLLSLEPERVAAGEFWRLFTSNFVHFGWAHTLMNLAAFLLTAYALFLTFSTARLLGLIVFCCLSVGIAVYYLNPEYGTYAGLSGATHGFIVAGLLLNKRHPYWVSGIFIGLTVAKIVYEHQPDYQATELQQLISASVAYDAHLYGALAGFVFGLGALAVDRFTPQKATV